MEQLIIWHKILKIEINRDICNQRYTTSPK